MDTRILLHTVGVELGYDVNLIAGDDGEVVMITLCRGTGECRIFSGSSCVDEMLRYLWAEASSHQLTLRTVRLKALGRHSAT